jgi:hypothetical protein
MLERTLERRARTNSSWSVVWLCAARDFHHKHSVAPNLQCSPNSVICCGRRIRCLRPQVRRMDIGVHEVFPIVVVSGGGRGRGRGTGRGRGYSTRRGGRRGGSRVVVVVVGGTEVLMRPRSGHRYGRRLRRRCVCRNFEGALFF